MNMKVSKRDISILLIALGLIGAFCVYQFYFRGALSKKKTYEDETKELQQRLNKLNGIDQSTLIADMGAHAQELQEKAAEFPVAYLYEDLIMYMNDWQELPYDEIYTEIYNFPQYSITETTMEDPLSGVIDWNPSKREPISATYLVGKATIDASYETNGYKAFKDMINTIYLDKRKNLAKTIDEVTATFDPVTGYVSGHVVIDFYNAMELTAEEPKEYKPVTIENVPTGVKSIFGPTYTPTPTPTPTPDPRQQQHLNLDEDE